MFCEVRSGVGSWNVKSGSTEGYTKKSIQVTILSSLIAAAPMS